MRNGFIVAIDGPVAAGKGTIAPLLAERLNGYYLYTGAMYRALALYVLEAGIDFKNKKEIISLIPQINFHFSEHQVIVNGKDVTERIQGSDVGKAVPFVAEIPEVRDEMVKKQRQVAEKLVVEGKKDSLLRHGSLIVAEGRDVGTKIFPDAELKVFLTASAEVRAKRRVEQFISKGENNVAYENVLKDVIERDKRDTEREIDPLLKDPLSHGYFILDNSNLTEEETIQAIIDEIKSKDLNL